jgi:hypothetical protein
LFVSLKVQTRAFCGPALLLMATARDVLPGVKFAVIDTGPVMVTDVDADAAAATGPVQFANTLPAAAVAVTGTTAPAAKKDPVDGATVPLPAGATAVVNWYSVENVAV